MNDFLFRIDDIGASTKRFNQHGRSRIRIGKWSVPVPFTNVGFLKRIEPFRGWAPYGELTAAEWDACVRVFAEHQIKPIVAVTACWVERDGTLVPFPEKFPEEAAALKSYADRGLITIANHGLTHCIVGKHLPRLFHSNRRFHREFYPELDSDIHEAHIIHSQHILEQYFAMPITVFVPPGNVWSKKTYHAIRSTNLKTVISREYMRDSAEPMEGIAFVSDREHAINIHDRELKLYGTPWLVRTITDYTRSL